MQYELCFLIGETQESGLEAIKKDALNIIAEEGGAPTGEEMSEKRKMAYEINRQRRGIYTALRFETPTKDEENYKGNVIEKITNKLNLYSGILRFLIVKADELPSLRPRKETAPAKQQPREEKPVSSKPTAPKPAEEKVSGDLIDKQLEEILNI